MASGSTRPRSTSLATQQGRASAARLTHAIATTSRGTPGSRDPKIERCRIPTNSPPTGCRRAGPPPKAGPAQAGVDSATEAPESGWFLAYSSSLGRRVIGEIIPESCIHLCEEPETEVVRRIGLQQAKQGGDDVPPLHKAILGSAMRARGLASQRVEVRLGCKILNTMTALGIPDGEMIG